MSGSVREPEREWTVECAPGAFPLLGHGIALFRRPLEFLNSLPAHGDLVEVRLGPQRAWVVCHPELAHRMLLDTSTFDKGGTLYDRLRSLMGDGVVTCPHARHRRQRRLLQPAFRPSRAAEHADLMGEEAAAVAARWRAGQDVDVSAAMMTVTARVMSRVLFSDSLDPATHAEVRRCLADVVRGLFIRTIVPVDAVFRVPTPANRRYRRSVDRLHAIVDAVVAERRGGDAQHDDLLGVLLAAASDEDGGVTDREVHDQLITLLLTGVETAALCLTSAFDLLAGNPEAERGLHAELDTVLADGRRPGADDLPRLGHTRAVVTETLRHSPPGWLFTRVTTRDTELAGHRLARGTTVLYSPYLLHHDPASFPEPERFLPERWLSGRTAARREHALVPFAAGSRKCLGEGFAMTEVTLALATIAARWRLTHRPGGAPESRPAVTLGPRALRMTCEPRTHQRTGAAHRTTIRVPDSRMAGGNGADDA
ncbi:cytochrome P450 [Streptomyces sp.]|uniref:cytochrome P450 n=1 Tax=Streptomyces sp. TaxID=1931 RepID=UPI002D647954|nr:cytochrome P450 [Streptomyces sp.]HZF91081.1 cytochrome P450 [Streptomyces sp.]